MQIIEKDSNHSPRWMRLLEHRGGYSFTVVWQKRTLSKEGIKKKEIRILRGESKKATLRALLSDTINFRWRAQFLRGFIKRVRWTKAKARDATECLSTRRRHYCPPFKNRIVQNRRNTFPASCSRASSWCNGLWLARLLFVDREEDPGWRVIKNRPGIELPPSLHGSLLTRHNFFPIYI